MTIHWCGTGLSAVPGLRRLIQNGHKVKVWNRTIAKAEEAVGDLNVEIAAMDAGAIKAEIQKDDILVSMLPGDWHVPLAKIAIDAGAHFVSSSYIAPEMRDLDGAAKEAGVSLVNEIGLDPGIDHLMAHWLVADYTGSDAFDAGSDLTFRSYCGGIPMHANAFKYKFSWSPLGVLKALKSPSKSIKNHGEHNVARPWDDVTTYTAPLHKDEDFEVYPNRDSLPFMEDYGFDPAWKVKEFVRGTLRLNGWTEAWADIFALMEELANDPAADDKLAAKSDELWNAHAYDEGEPDRVVMCVELQAEKGGESVYHKTFTMDAWGDENSTAMARLVSIPLSLAIESVAKGEYAPGVHAATKDPAMIEAYLAEVRALAQHVDIVDLTAR